MTEAKPATRWLPNHSGRCTINNPWAEKKACDCGLAETLTIALYNEALHLDTERAARLAAEARVKVLEEALRWAQPLAELSMEDHRQRRLTAGHDDIRGTRSDGTLVVGLWQNEIDQIESARAALKEPANG